MIEVEIYTAIEFCAIQLNVTTIVGERLYKPTLPNITYFISLKTQVHHNPGTPGGLLRLHKNVYLVIACVFYKCTSMLQHNRIVCDGL